MTTKETQKLNSIEISKTFYKIDGRSNEFNKAQKILK